MSSRSVVSSDGGTGVYRNRRLVARHGGARRNGKVLRRPHTPDRVERPQATLIEGDNFIERVEGTAVGIAGAVRKLFQLTENSDIGLCTQQLLQLRQGGDAVSAQEPAQHVSGKESGTHNDVIPPYG